MTGIIIVLGLWLSAAPDGEQHPQGFKAELLADTSDVLVGDVVVTKLRVINRDRIPLLLWSLDVARSGYATYEFRRNDGDWQKYQLFQENPVRAARGQYDVRLAPDECQSELMTWERNDNRRSVFSEPTTYGLRGRYRTVLGELITPEIKVNVSKPAKGDTVEQENYPLRLPWEFKVSRPVNFHLADSMEASNSKQILRDVQRLNDFLTTRKVAGQSISPNEFLKWLDKQNPVRRECLLIPMGNACATNWDVEGLRAVIKRMPDRSSHRIRLEAILAELEHLFR